MQIVPLHRIESNKLNRRISHKDFEHTNSAGHFVCESTSARGRCNVAVKHANTPNSACHIKGCYVMSCYLLLCYFMLLYVTSCHVMLCQDNVPYSTIPYNNHFCILVAKVTSTETQKGVNLFYIMHN